MRNKQIGLNIILMVIFGSLMLLLMTSCDEDKGQNLGAMVTNCQGYFRLIR